MFLEEYKKLLVLFLSVVAVAFILFWPSLSGSFTLDDHSVIEKGLQNRSFIENLFEVWVSPWHPGGQWAGNYRPLTSLSFALNLIFSESPVGFRIVNVLLYALNAVVMFYVVRKISNQTVASVAAVIFLFLPIHSEAVMSVVGRVYLLGTFFSLVSLYYFLDKKYWVSSAHFLLALLAGDVFMSVILIMGALLLLENKNLAVAIKTAGIYMIGLPVYFLLRYLALGKYAFGGYGFIDPIIGPLAFVSAKERIFTAFSHLYLYLRKTVWPADLSPDYSFNQIPIVSDLFSSWRALAGLAFLLILIYIFYRTKRKDVRFAVILFLAPYLVISNIFFITTGTMAERWWYFPSFGLTMLAAIGIERLLARFKNIKRYIYGMGAIIIILYSAIIFRQNKIWLNDRNLFIYASEISPSSAWARTNVAEGFFLSGDVERAKEEIAAALDISDQYPSALYVLGQIYWNEGRFGEAEEVLKKALEFDIYDRNKRSFYRSLALIDLDTGNNGQALVHMQEAVKWPAMGDIEKTLKIDKLLLQRIEEYADRDINSYTQEEKEELAKLIKIIRGF